MKSNLKLVVHILIFSFIFFTFGSLDKTYSATCDTSKECNGSGEYVCGSAKDYCCTGTGCLGTCTAQGFNGGCNQTPDIVWGDGDCWDGMTEFGDYICGGTQYGTCGPCGGGSSNPPPAPHDPKGWHDSSDCISSRGWACDPDNYDTALTVKFYADGNSSTGTLIDSTVANITPTDPTDLAGIKASCGGKGAHRFNFPTPDSVKNGVAHSIYAYAVNIDSGSDFLLSGSPPKPLTCAPPAPATANCNIVGGPIIVHPNVSSSYIVTYSAGVGPVTGRGLVVHSDSESDCNKNVLYSTNSGGPGTISFPWTPNAIGNYTLDCRAWNDGIAECRGNCVTSPPVYACLGPSAKLAVRVCGLPPDTPSVTASCTTTPTSMTFTWGPPITNYWGDICTTSARQYDVVADTQADPTTLISGCTKTANTSCIISSLTPGTTRNWKVSAFNGEFNSPYTAPFSCTIPTEVNDWFTSVDGDVFANGISVTVPSTANALWIHKTIGYGTSTVFNSGSANTVVINGNYLDTTNPAPSESLTWVDRMPLKISGNMWNPYKGTFDIPSGAVNVGGWNNLKPDTVYYFNGSSLSGAPHLNYDFCLNCDGVVVVYLTHNGTITIKTDIISLGGANKRLVLVSNSDIVIESGVYTANPTISSTPNIEAAIITSGSITFDPDATPPTVNPSIVVEGPLAALSGLTFNRGPLSTYSYPSEVVVYNPLILSKLTAQERASSTYNYTGLFTSEIIWEGDL